MRIQHNISAINANRQYAFNNDKLSKNLQKLSSGYKINNAADDAAGLAISEKMRSQIRGLDQATNNANDGISLVQTAEGGLNETASILQRMKELATQSSNGTYQNDVDRENIQKEVTSLMSEIDRISSSTNFNKINLLDGSLGGGKIGATGTITGPGTKVEVSGAAAGIKVVFAASTDGAKSAATAAWSGGDTLTISLKNSTSGNTATYSQDEINSLIASVSGNAPAGAANLKVSLDKDISLTQGGSSNIASDITMTAAKPVFQQYGGTVSGTTNKVTLTSDVAGTPSITFKTGDGTKKALSVASGAAELNLIS